MTVPDAVLWLKANGIPDHAYVVDGLGGGECHGIRRQGPRWQLYYSERGQANVFATFDSEAEACAVWVREIAGALGVPGPAEGNEQA